MGHNARERGYLKFCVSEPYFSKGEKYRDQERDFGRVTARSKSEIGCVQPAGRCIESATTGVTVFEQVLHGEESVDFDAGEP
jgi:hypothetical protein